MIPKERVDTIRRLAIRGWSIESIARQVDVSPMTVRRYVGHTIPLATRIRPKARRLSDAWRRRARALFRGDAAGNAAIVHRLMAEHGIRVSLRTIRRVVATEGGLARATHSATTRWQRRRAEESKVDLLTRESNAEISERAELDLVKRISKAKGRTDSDELESELTLHLAHLRERLPDGITNWKAFLVTALNRRADTWVGALRRDIRRTTSLNRDVIESDRAGTLEDLLIYVEATLEDQTALSLVREEIDPRLNAVWEALVRTNGNQVQAAEQLRIHRNTLRLLILQIRDILGRHGF